MVEEKLCKNLESNSKFFWLVKSFVIKGIERIFGCNSKDKEIINYATENRKDAKVIVNYVNTDQKYILGIDSHNKKLVFATDNLPHHISIKHKYISDGFCLGGGRVTIDDENKIISLHGKSKVYGNIPGDIKEIMANLLKKIYPDYKISFRN